MNRFDDKTIVITGAGSGIGRGSAFRFADEGANVVVTDIIEETGEETVEQIEDNGGEASFLKVDVTSQSDVEEMVDFAVEQYGSLDFAHNNAGLAGNEQLRTDEMGEERWNNELDLDLTGVWRCMKAEIPQMLEQGGGSIVNMGSDAGLTGAPYLVPYAVSKHGVIGLTRTAALEYAMDGIRVNAVCPGPVRTPSMEDLTDEQIDQYTGEIPMNEMATPEDIAGAVSWLCSDDAQYVTGLPLPIDGGKSAQ